MNANLASSAAPHLVHLADLDENKVTPGLLGFVVFALIGGATWLLMRSMNKQLKRVDFDTAPEGRATAPAGGGAEPDAKAAGRDAHDAEEG